MQSLGRQRYQALADERVEKRIPLKALIFEGEVASWMRGRPWQELRELKILPNTQVFPSSYQCSKHKALLW